MRARDDRLGEVGRVMEEGTAAWPTYPTATKNPWRVCVSVHLMNALSPRPSLAGPCSYGAACRSTRDAAGAAASSRLLDDC